MPPTSVLRERRVPDEYGQVVFEAFEDEEDELLHRLGGVLLEVAENDAEDLVSGAYPEDLHLEADEFGGVCGEDGSEDVDPAVVGGLERAVDDGGVCLVGPSQLGEA